VCVRSRALMCARLGLGLVVLACARVCIHLGEVCAGGGVWLRVG